MKLNKLTEQITERINKECAVTGREIINPVTAPGSNVNGMDILFCCSTCKKYFDRYLVKFAKKLFPAPERPAYALMPSTQYKR